MSAKITIVWEDSEKGDVVSAEGAVVLSDNKDNLLMYSQDVFEEIVKNYARLMHVNLCKCREG
jgi:hypothetical protein